MVLEIDNRPGYILQILNIALLLAGPGPITPFRFSLVQIIIEKYPKEMCIRDSSIADFNGNRIWLRYVGDTLTQMEFPSGQSLSFTYNANKIASIRDTLGRTLRYTCLLYTSFSTVCHR